MPTNFPTKPDTYTTKVDGVDTVMAAHINDLQDATTAIEQALLGVIPDGNVQYLKTPEWQSWTPASQTGWTAMPTGTFRYINIGKLVILAINVTAGTSNNATTCIALPFTAASSGGWSGTMGYAMNNGAGILTATRWNIAAGATHIFFFTDMGAAGWAESGTKLVNCVAIYEKA